MMRVFWQFGVRVDVGDRIYWLPESLGVAPGPPFFLFYQLGFSL